MAAKRKLGKMAVAEPSLEKAKVVEVPDYPPLEEEETIDIDKTLESSTIEASLDQPKKTPSKVDPQSRNVISYSPRVIEQMLKDLGTSTPSQELHSSRSTSPMPLSDFEKMVQSILSSPSFTSIHPPSPVSDPMDHCRSLVEQQLLVCSISLNLIIIVSL